MDREISSSPPVGSRLDGREQKVEGFRLKYKDYGTCSTERTEDCDTPIAKIYSDSDDTFKLAGEALDPSEVTCAALLDRKFASSAHRYLDTIHTRLPSFKHTSALQTLRVIGIDRSASIRTHTRRCASPALSTTLSPFCNGTTPSASCGITSRGATRKFALDESQSLIAVFCSVTLMGCRVAAVATIRV